MPESEPVRERPRTDEPVPLMERLELSDAAEPSICTMGMPA
jgi:hypothetical protein